MTMKERHIGGPAETAVGSQSRSLIDALKRGAMKRCPRCGQGHLFHGLLKVRGACGSCGLDYSGHRADDLPPYLTILVVGHVLTAGVLFMEENYAMSTMFSIAFWSVVATCLSLLLLPRIKGAVIGLQWAYGMHGFGEGDGWAEQPAPGPAEEETAAR
ncbi:MAG: DUF983 domain-containing protein [Neomegalonema sp.]|nr:DUF983 domain-containing protein [Neomegalonema sp.]